MKVYELLYELRSNVKLNLQKKAGHSEAVEFLKKHWKNKAIEEYGISMTDEPKLGINPGTKYNTPVGVYFYPASYYLETKENNNSLEFQDDAPYIQVFKFNTDAILEIDTVDETAYHEYIKMLFNNINRVARLINISEKNAIGELSSLVSNASDAARIDSYGGYLWYVLYSLSSVGSGSSVKTSRSTTQAKRGPVIWNSLIRLLGIDIIIDNGAGIIHENEPCQGVVINPRTIQLAKTVENIMPLTPDKAKELKIHKTAKLINKPSENTITRLFVVTAKFKGKPNEHIKLYASNSLAAEAEAVRYWNNRKDMVDLSVVQAKNTPPKKIVKKKGEKPLKSNTFLVKINYYDDHGIGQETCVISAYDEADASDKAAKFLNIPGKLIHSIEVKKK